MRQRGSSASGEFEYVSEQVKDWLEQAQQQTFTSIWAAITSTFTLSNIKESIRYYSLLSCYRIVNLSTP